MPGPGGSRQTELFPNNKTVPIGLAAALGEGSTITHISALDPASSFQVHQSCELGVGSPTLRLHSFGVGLFFCKGN